MKKNWVVFPQDELYQVQISQQFGISPILSQILINRGLTTFEEIKKFLFTSTSQLYSPFLLKGMESACQRIKKAIEKKEKITIYGDYDADGITAISLLLLTLRQLKAKVDYYIPSRLEEGYGLHKASIEKIKKDGCSLIITVDCGIGAIEEVDYAQKLKIDLIITDHHEPGEVLPRAFSLICPKRKDSEYPFMGLAGVGVAFKLSQALFTTMGYPASLAEQWLDLVSLGTVADVAPLLEENRILVKEGLKKINEGTNLGLAALKKVTHLAMVNTYHLSFVLGPRVNALGRLSTAHQVVELLTTTNYQKAEQIAQKLEEENRTRQKIEKEIMEEVLEKIEREEEIKKQKVFVLSSENWHHGVIGIVAAKVVERYHRPTIIITLMNGEGKGSGRSVNGFHLYKALLFSKETLKTFGGHELAAGLLIDPAKLMSFNQKIQEFAEENWKNPEKEKEIKIDLLLPLEQVNLKLIEEIKKLSPFGIGNPRPRFLSLHLKVKGSPKIIKGQHLKFLVEKNNTIREAIGFGRAYLKEEMGEKINLVYTPTFNIYQGFSSIQLNIEDLEKVEGEREKLKN
jgi:single-stranded-DNA-specific exonuclease